MDQIRELDSVLNEEDRNVITHQVPVTFWRVHFHRETANVPGGISGAPRTCYGRKSHKHGGLQSRVGENFRGRVLGERLIDLKKTVGCRPSGMYHPLGNPVMIEVLDLLSQYLIFHQSGPAMPRL